MKLDDVRRLAASGEGIAPRDQQEIYAFLHRAGIDPSNLYQELEMSSPYVDTHQDVTYSNMMVSLHSHDFYELLYCRSVEDVEYLVDSHRYRLQKGDIVVIPPGISHRPILPPDMQIPYIRDVIWISKTYMHTICGAFPQVFSSALAPLSLIRTEGTHWEFLGELFQRGIWEAEKRNFGWEAAIAGNTLQLMAYLARAQTEHTAGVMRAEKPELLDLITAYIETHYAERFTVGDLARRFYVSDSSISHLFKEKMGVSLYHYVTQRRLISAKNLIAAGVALEQVATRVGFSDYSAFYRAFRQEYGISPRQFKNL